MITNNFITLPKFVPQTISIYGMGGIGSNVGLWLPAYMQHSTYLRDACSLRFIDADVVEAKNLERQPFYKTDIGKNKADVIHRRCLNILAGISTIPLYVTDANIENELQAHTNNALIFLCVDNNYTRKLIIEAFVDRYEKDFLILMTGNERHTGSVDSFGRIAGRFYGVDPRNQPQIANPTDAGPREQGCANDHDFGTNPTLLNSQIASANRQAASLGMQVFEQVLRANQIVTHIRFDVRNCSSLGQNIVTIGAEENVPVEVE